MACGSTKLDRLASSRLSMLKNVSVLSLYGTFRPIESGAVWARRADGENVGCNGVEDRIRSKPDDRCVQSDTTDGDQWSVLVF